MGSNCTMLALPHTPPSERVVLGNRYAHSIPSLVCSLNALEPSIAPSELGGSVHGCRHKRTGKISDSKYQVSLPSAESCAIDSSIRSCTSSPVSVAAAIGIVRERCNAWSCCIRVLQSHSTRAQPLVVAIPFAKPAMSCLDFLSPHAPCSDLIGELGLAR